MVFASGTFLFVFFPLTLVGYWLLRKKSVNVRNLFLLTMSLGFYLNSGLRQFILLLFSIFINYVIALAIAKANQHIQIHKALLILAVMYNVGMLFVFKYLTFLGQEIGRLLNVSEHINLEIALPLGISFYTFQALSYVIDVYRDASLVETNIANVTLYVSFFPQLIAGPIVRWDSIRTDLRTKNKNSFAVRLNNGLHRFAIGLGKKVIIANQMAIFADKSFAMLNANQLTTQMAWLGAFSYTMQIYFDFSGYSDMAIGLGEIFGFYFPENFNYPYISASITEFWRRWHISLSTWFRDYVYIPLGGNKCSKQRMLFNLLVVWTLTGIWHGANYTFWIWGILYFILLMFEKTCLRGQRRTTVFGKIVGHLYTLFAITMLWVIFRADNIKDAWDYIIIMLGGRQATGAYALGVTKLYIKNSIGYGALAVIACIPWKNLWDKVSKNRKNTKWNVVWEICSVLIFIIAVCMTIDGDYNPFVYFNF